MQIVLHNITNGVHSLKSYYYTTKEERVVISNHDQKTEIQLFLKPDEVAKLKDILFNRGE